MESFLFAMMVLMVGCLALIGVAITVLTIKLIIQLFKLLKDS